MISNNHLLGLLEKEFLLATTDKRTNQPLNDELTPVLVAIRDQFITIIEEHGDIENSASFDELCTKLKAAQTEISRNESILAEVDQRILVEVGSSTTDSIDSPASNETGKTAAEVMQKLLARITRMRSTIRKQLEISVGWKSGPVLKGGRPTETAFIGLSQLHEQLGWGTLHTKGPDYMTQDELLASKAIAAIIGEVALADYWSAVAPDRFAFNNQSIENLGQWIGDYQSTYQGNPLEDVPLSLLTLPSLGSLRDLFFNRLRDKYYEELYKDSSTGIEPVLEELTNVRDTLSEHARLEFIDELIDYFIQVEDLQIPARLKDNVSNGNGNGEFPAKHQRIAVVEIERQHQLLLADEVGGGKTGSFITAFEHLRELGKATRSFITCPSNITGVWEKRLTDVNGGYFKEGEKPHVVFIRPGDPKREQAWQEARRADYVVCSIELLRESTKINDPEFAATLGVAPGTNVSHERLAQYIEADTFGIDEAHNVKNPDGKDTDRIFAISQTESIRDGYTVVMTATPVYNTVRDIAAQLRLLNAGQDRLKDAEGIPKDIEFSDIKQLTNAIARNHSRLVRNLLLLRMLRRETKDTLPVGTTKEIEPPSVVEFSPLEQARYDALYEDPFWDASDKIEELRRFCVHGGHDEFEENQGLAGSTKFNQVMDYVREMIAEYRGNPAIHNGKILLGVPRGVGGLARGVTRDWDDNNDPVTSNQEAYLAGRIREELAKEGIPVFILDGAATKSNAPLRVKGEIQYDIDGAPLTPKRKIIADCREHDGPAILMLRTDVGGEGIDLSFIARGAMITPTSVQSEEDQLVGRMYRRGQEHAVKFRTLMIDNTIEVGMSEFALRKKRIIEDLLYGKPLSSEEENLLNSEIGKVRKGGYLAYEMMTPRQKIMQTFLRIFAAGKEKVRAYFAGESGKFARDFAECYLEEEDLSFAGNNKRMLLALINKYAPELQQYFEGEKLQMADVACGCLGMARALEHDEQFDVYSSDICAPMLEVGSQAMKQAPTEDAVHECAMDELPYEDESQHIVVHSLALQYTFHNPRKLESGGNERVQALCEMNRVLKKGGVAFVALPPYLFEKEGKFAEVCSTLNEHFGFQVISRDSNVVRSADDDPDTFESYVITLEKVGPAEASHLPMDAWLTLEFSREGISRWKKSQERTPRDAQQPQSSPVGAYHETFMIGDQKLTYQTPDELSAAKDEYTEGKEEYDRISSQALELLQKYDSVKNIPPEKLLSISLEAIDPTHETSREAQEVRDAYFKALFEKYDGKLDRIPLSEISAQSSVILMRGYTKKKGAYLCFARLDGKKRKSYGTRYFYEDDHRDDV